MDTLATGDLLFIYLFTPVCLEMPPLLHQTTTPFLKHQQNVNTGVCYRLLLKFPEIFAPSILYNLEFLQHVETS